MIAAYPAAAPRQFPAQYYRRYRVLYRWALDMGMGLTEDENDVLWLAWQRPDGHGPVLSQPCLSLDEVENALADGSPWRQLVARVGRGER